MAKDKKLSAKVNGVKLKDGDTVVIVMEATVSIKDKTTFAGDSYRDVEFVTTNGENYFDAYDDSGKYKKFEISGATLLRVKP